MFPYVAINPEIKRFCENRYGNVYFNGQEYFQFIGMTGIKVATITANGLVYHFHGDHNEKEMLRLIRLKAFL